MSFKLDISYLEPIDLRQRKDLSLLGGVISNNQFGETNLAVTAKSRLVFAEALAPASAPLGR